MVMTLNMLDRDAAPPLSSDYSVVSLVKLRLQGAWRIELLHSRPCHRLYWVTRGQGRATINGVTRGYGPNTAIFIPANVQMAFELASHTQGLVLAIPPGANLDVPKDPFHLRVMRSDAQSMLIGHIEGIERELVARAPAMARALLGYGFLISTWMERELARQDELHRPEKSQFLVENFARLMERYFRSGKKITAYAAELNVTPTHLSRVCKQFSGRPAHALLNERVMYEAQCLLLETDMTAREIADTLGFSSPAYFTRAFAQAVGYTPLAYRAAG